MQTVEYSEKPSKYTYMGLPDGMADVWLRDNITEVTVTEASSATENQEATSWTKWTADEVYFRTALSEEEIEENFDTLFANGGPVVDTDTGEEQADGITTADRLDAVEAGLTELAELITELLA